MARSIANRTFRIVLFSTLFSLYIALALGWWGLEHLEAAMLEAEYTLEVEYFDKYGDKHAPLRIDTAQVTVVYQPKDSALTSDLPIIFHKLPIPFKGEVDALGTEYMVITHAFPEGTFYLAKTLQLFEDQEEQTINTVLAVALVVGLIGYLLALMASRNISAPVTRLTTELRKAKAETTGARIKTDYADQELNEIALATNDYIRGIEEGLKHQRSFLSMASHELKTPVSVILGATSVIESREQLHANDKITLKRIKDAAEEMSNNIQALLNLSRQSKNLNMRRVLWRELFTELEKDLQLSTPSSAHRLRFTNDADCAAMEMDPVLVKMLLNNLIHNALNYTSGNVVVTLKDDGLTVSDEGVEAEKNPAESWSTSGLGLYIVDQLCQQLKWHYQIIPKSGGSCVNIIFQATQ